MINRHDHYIGWGTCPRFLTEMIISQIWMKFLSFSLQNSAFLCRNIQFLIKILGCRDLPLTRVYMFEEYIYSALTLQTPQRKLDQDTPQSLGRLISRISMIRTEQSPAVVHSFFFIPENSSQCKQMLTCSHTHAHFQMFKKGVENEVTRKKLIKPETWEASMRWRNWSFCISDCQGCTCCSNLEW